VKVVCYFADADGSHPHCSTAEYDRIWPVMQKSVERCGYELIQLTSRKDKPRCANVVRYDIDPATVMFSREVAWLAYLEQAQEEVVMVEPDCFMLRPVPPLADGKDMLLLQRPGRVLPSGFRLAKASAAPFYRAVVEEYSKWSHDDKVFHGDCKVHHLLLGIGKGGAIDPPTSWNSVQIEVRNWIDYTSKLWRRAVAWNFKGTSKDKMLAMADGHMPRMR
jgi:hypothetical protein